MRLLKILVVASLVGIVFLQARAYLSPPTPPSHASRLPELGRKIAERVVAPIAARADRGGRSRWW